MHLKFTYENVHISLILILTYMVLLSSGFDLTFQKWFVSFPNENNRKTDLKFCAPWISDEENFEIHQICNKLWKTYNKKEFY